MAVVLVEHPPQKTHDQVPPLCSRPGVPIGTQVLGEVPLDPFQKGAQSFLGSLSIVGDEVGSYFFLWVRVAKVGTESRD